MPKDDNKADAQPMTAKVTLQAIQPIEHDGVRYEPGQTFEVEPRQAKPLLEVGAASEVAAG